MLSPNRKQPPGLLFYPPTNKVVGYSRLSSGHGLQSTVVSRRQFCSSDKREKMTLLVGTNSSWLLREIRLFPHQQLSIGWVSELVVDGWECMCVWEGLVKQMLREDCRLSVWSWANRGGKRTHPFSFRSQPLLNWRILVEGQPTHQLSGDAMAWQPAFWPFRRLEKKLEVLALLRFHETSDSWFLSKDIRGSDLEEIIMLLSPTPPDLPPLYKQASIKLGWWKAAEMSAKYHPSIHLSMGLDLIYSDLACFTSLRARLSWILRWSKPSSAVFNARKKKR